MASDPSEIASFIRRFQGDDLKIRFQPSADDDETLDANEEFRSAVLERALEEPEEVSLTLWAALYRAMTEHAAEAWGADPRLEDVAREMLIQGGAAMARDYVLGAAQSFDAYCATSFAGCPRSIAEDCLRHARERLSAATDEEDKDLWKMGVERFENLLRHAE